MLKKKVGVLLFPIYTLHSFLHTFSFIDLSNLTFLSHLACSDPSPLIRLPKTDLVKICLVDKIVATLCSKVDLNNDND